jgi:hypothetical protein
MGVDINWGLLGRPADIGAAFQSGRDRGQARGALGVLARDPTNADALAGLAQVAPEELYRFQAANRQQSDWNRGERFRGALSAYQRGNLPTPDALAGGVPPAPNALASKPPLGRSSDQFGQQAGPPLGNTLTDFAANGMSPPTPNALLPDNGYGPDIIVQSRRPSVAAPIAPMRPPGGADWDSVVAADPVAAMEARKQETEWQSKRLKLTKDDLDAHQAVNSAAIQLLNGVTDQATYDRAREESARLYEQYGYEHPELPTEYNAELINALRHRALEIKDDIAADLSERKFDWQRQDDRIDNARDDRRVAITDRSARASDARGWRADRRAQVRFGERALDRQAMAGIRSDTSDLDY